MSVRYLTNDLNRNAIAARDTHRSEILDGCISDMLGGLRVFVEANLNEFEQTMSCDGEVADGERGERGSDDDNSTARRTRVDRVG